MVKGHPLSTYAKFSEKLTFLPSLPPCAYQGVGNININIVGFWKSLHTQLMDDP